MPRLRHAEKRKVGRPRIETPHPVDVHVGARVRLRRTLTGLSQEKLGAAIGLTFQQVQKYERGANRIGCSRLFDIAAALEVPVSFFFEEFGGGDTQRATPEPGGDRSLEADLISKRETLELVRAYYGIPDPTLRKRTFELIKAAARFASSEGDPRSKG